MNLPPDLTARQQFAQLLIAWQRRHGRHDLPWQNTRDPYRIWLSEIMLQQTQVSTVIPYYQRFLASFPSLADLAAAPLERVLEHWAGLGYYARARNLHACARTIVDQHGGLFPRHSATIATLPGIGRSTAAAIAAFAFKERAAILDGNVKRVLCRVFAVEGFPGSSAVEKRLWQLAEDLLPNADIERYTQGIMDLGASLCARSQPQCAACPMQPICRAHGEGRTAELPAAKPGKALPERYSRVLIASDGARVLLQRRPPNGIWGGLLALPELAEQEDPAQAAARLGLTPLGAAQALASLRHSFTHFRLTLTPSLVTVTPVAAVNETGQGEWIAWSSVATAALPTPIRKLLLAAGNTSAANTTSTASPA